MFCSIFFFKKKVLMVVKHYTFSLSEGLCLLVYQMLVGISWGKLLGADTWKGKSLPRFKYQHQQFRCYRRRQAGSCDTKAASGCWNNLLPGQGQVVPLLCPLTHRGHSGALLLTRDGNHLNRLRVVSQRLERDASWESTQDNYLFWFKLSEEN